MAEKKKLTPEERKKIEDQIAELNEALKDQAEGEATPAEVEEEKRKLAALFDRLNITEEDYDVLVAGLAAGTEERTRRIVREELAAEEEGEEGGSLKDLETDPNAPPNTQKPPPDQEPKAKHWTERKLFGKDDD